MLATTRANLTKQNTIADKGPGKVHQITALLLYCLLNYWHIAESYAVTPEARMYPDRSLNWFGGVFFTLWTAAPLMAWGLFLWTLVTGLKQYALTLPGEIAAPEITLKGPFYFQAYLLFLF